MGHNILRPSALEGAELGGGHPNILGFKELGGQAENTTYRVTGVALG